MNANNMNGKHALMLTMLAMAVMLFSPFATVLDAADGGRTVDVSVYAGSSLQYDDIVTPVDRTGTYLTIEGSMASYLTLQDRSLKGTVPSNLSEGTYECRIIAHGNTNYTITLRVHVQENPMHYSASDLNLIPTIDRVGVAKIAGSAKNISLHMSTTKADSVIVDYNDGIITSPIMVSGTDTISTHSYEGSGMYTIKISASNNYGTDNLVLLYDSSTAELTPADSSEEDKGFEMPMWGWIAIGVAVILAGVFILPRVI